MSEIQEPADSGAALSNVLADLKEQEALDIVRLRMQQGDDPMQIIEDCQAGMREVGERYAQQRYFLAALIMSAEILAEIMEMVLPGVEARYSGKSSGRILVGTVQGDIHDLGKNMLLMLLRSYGFSVMDLGVDVAPGRFVDAARDFQPHVIGLSGLLIAAHASMRETVQALRAMMAEDDAVIPIVLGGQVDEQVCRYVGADYWTTDAMQGVRLCQRLVGEH